MADTTVVIVHSARTPIGTLCGALSNVKVHQLGSAVISEVLNRAKVSPEDVSEVIMGQALTAGCGQNPARQSSIDANIPETVPAYTVNQLCGSGLKTVFLGYQSIRSGDSNVVVCGGQESMTLAPHSIYLRSPTKMGNANLVCTMTHDGLTDAFHGIHMGITAENIAEKYKISREDQDLFATRSQNKAEIAQSQGFFDEEIIPIQIKIKNESLNINKDQFPRHGTTHQKLEKLKPCFKKDGSVTPGNSSGVNDGAAAVLLMSLDEAHKRNITPQAKIVGFAEAGVDPKVMGLGPIPAIKKLLKKISWSIDDVDLFELNEAFAAQSIAVIKELGIDESRVNINGGAISLGHPVGASGARVLVTLIYALKRTGKTKGIASLCVGGGMGIAIAIEMF